MLNGISKSPKSPWSNPNPHPLISLKLLNINM